MWYLLKFWRVIFIPGAAGAIFRILAWPPSRKKFDDIVNGK
jgi:hypothetical protein